MRELEHLGALAYALRLKDGERGLESGDREAEVIDADPIQPRARRVIERCGGGAREFDYRSASRARM